MHANQLMDDNRLKVRESNDLMSQTIEGLSRSNDEIIKVQNVNSIINEMAQSEKDNISLQLSAVEDIEHACTTNLSKISSIENSSLALTNVSQSFEEVTSSFKTNTRLH